MTLHPTMRRRLHGSLEPLIGEEEADALLDEISPSDPVTREWLEERFERIEERFERIEERFERIDERFERIDERFERIDERFDLQDQRFVTKEWAEERFHVKEHLDLKLEAMEHRITTAVASLEIRMNERFVTQNQWTVGAIAFIATVLTIVQIIWG